MVFLQGRYRCIHPKIQPKQLPRIIIQFLRETIGSLTTTAAATDNRFMKEC